MQRRGAAGGRRRGRGPLRRLGRWLGLAVLAWVVVSGALVLAMRWWNPLTSAFMLNARLEALAAGERAYVNDYRWVDLADVSPHAAVAVLAAEDQRFPFHHGFDLQAIREAIESNGRGGRLRGASTISQQVAKNLFLWPERSYVRKALEVWFTVLIEALWPKERILEIYVNIAEFGRGVYGVEAAAQRFFGKSAARLTRAEAALLAAVLPSPRRFRADRPSSYVAARREWIMRQMRGLGGASYLRNIEHGRATRS